MRIDLGPLATRWLEAGLDLFIPLRCAGCGRLGQVWCHDCDQSLARLSGPLCPICGGSRKHGATCRACRQAALTLRARSYARYQGPLLSAVLNLKYRPNRRMAAVMAGWLAGIVRGDENDYQLVVPVPLGPSRQRRRGYNQAALISKALAAELHLDHLKHGLERVRETDSQVGLNPNTRRKNVERAFQSASDKVQDKAVILVDDVFTTGATLAACATALRQAGASRILGLTVGRA